MEGLGCHICIGPRDEALLAPELGARRTMLRAALRAAAPYELLAAWLADTHLHGQTANDEKESRELARRTGIALAKTFGRPFETRFVKPVESLGHAYRLFDYILRQDEHHGFCSDPLAEGSTLPDLLGLRTIGVGTAATVRRWLPRVDRERLLGLLGVESLAEVRSAPLAEIVEAGMAAAALPALDLGEASRSVRCAVIEVAEGVPTVALANALAVHPRSIQRMRKAASADPRLVRALRLQLDLREQKRSVLVQLGGDFSRATEYRRHSPRR